MWSDPAVETVAPGIHRVPLPLPGDALKAINVYALEDEGDLTLIDAGWEGTSTWDALRTGLSEVGLEIRDVRRVLVTHLHADHIGQTTNLQRKIASEVVLGTPERRGLELSINDIEELRRARRSYIARAGGEELVPALRDQHDNLPNDVDWDLPGRWLAGGERIPLHGTQLEALLTPGHTQGHMCFFHEGISVLFSGDHVLPHITPSIGFEPYPTGRALGDFLSSLKAVRNRPVDLVLPAHGPPFTDLAGRVDELLEHHRARLDECEAAVTAQGTTPYMVAQALGWTRRQRRFADLDVFNQMLATSETLAHLELLASEGRVTVRERDGVLRFYSLAP